jgi:hypothetical protein
MKMFKGEIEPEDILSGKGDDDQLSLVTSGFGVANEYKFRGNHNKYVEILKRVLETNAWSGFGYLSAEVDMKKIKG